MAGLRPQGQKGMGVTRAAEALGRAGGTCDNGGASFLVTFAPSEFFFGVLNFVVWRPRLEGDLSAHIIGIYRMNKVGALYVVAPVLRCLHALLQLNSTWRRQQRRSPSG